MAIKYFPSSQIAPNLYTRGGEFVTSDGKSYTGRYYLTSDGRTFAGINPVVGTNEELARAETLQDSISFTSGASPQMTSTYNFAVTRNSSASPIANKETLTELTSYNPFPISEDYAKGYFTRYFAKNPSGPGFIIEISKEDWSLIQNKQIGNNVVGYQSTSLLWQLTGPLNNTRISQYQVQGGVYDTNKRVTEAKQTQFRGIVEFIGGDYTKFAQITSGSVAISGSR
jgi:hypothetical protein